MEDDIKKTLRYIMESVGADPAYANYAEFVSWIETLIKKWGK